MHLEERLDVENIRVSALIQHVENTLAHWDTLQRKPVASVHHKKLLNDLRQLQTLSKNDILLTQGII